MNISVKKRFYCYEGFICWLIFLFLITSVGAQLPSSAEIKLGTPDKNRGSSLMNALSQRASIRSWDTTKMSINDISDLLWAANGINRVEKGLRTAPSAHNAQDIDIFIFTEEGIYRYNSIQHSLIAQKKGDFRSIIGKQDYVAKAPLSIILVSDISRFQTGNDKIRLNWGALDAGMVSQNISLFCAASNLGTVPRTFFNEDKIRKALDLKSNQHIMLHHPIGYLKKD